MAGSGKHHVKNERGIALLIVMLVTALLIALVFEFAYATRISLNSAMNFRDSQRAYFLALSGVNAFKTHGAQLRENIRPGELQHFGEGDMGFDFVYNDESGKIKVSDVKTDPVTQTMVRNLLENKGIDARVYDRMTDQTSEINKLTFLSGLHEYMTHEDFLKVQDSFTVSPVPMHMVNINAASRDVLRSMGISADGAELIEKTRKERAYTQQDIANDLVNPINGLKIPPQTGNYIKAYLTATQGQIVKVTATATVGGYKKQFEAILNGSAVAYWKAL